MTIMIPVLRSRTNLNLHTNNSLLFPLSTEEGSRSEPRAGRVTSEISVNVSS